MEHDSAMAMTSSLPTSCKSKKSLGLLAEVALIRHQEEQQQTIEDLGGAPRSQELLISSTPPKTKVINRFFSLKQIRKLSEKKLLSTFAEYKKDLKRKYFCYKCQLLPHECQLKFECLNVENDLNIRNDMVNHLLEHVCNLESSMPNIKIASSKKVKPRKMKLPKAELKTESEKLNYFDHAYVQRPVVVESSNPAAVWSSASKNQFFSDNNKQFEPQLLSEQSVDNLVEVRTSTTAPIHPSAETQQQAQNMRELALDYIDDIRKKSSSAAKSIIVNGDKSVIYQCKICPDKQFTSTNGLIFHYKKHAGLKPYVCELCSATFTRQHSLNYHMLIHLNKSRFVCSECSRHFRHPSHFKEHMRRHTGETPFQCGDCLIKFKTRNTYKRHLQTKHSKILTSKGIIELSNQVPYQSAPKATTNTVSVSIGSGGTPVVVKPRRKYGIRFVPKINEMGKFETQASTLTPAATMLTTSAGSDGTINLIAGNGTIAAATAQTAPGSNITILSIPAQLPATTMHILDGGMASASAATFERIGGKNEYKHPAQHSGITLLSYQPVLAANTTTSTTALVDSLPGTVQSVEPLTQVQAVPSPQPNSANLTELTSVVVVSPQQPDMYSGNQHSMQLPEAQPPLPPVATAAAALPPPTTNDNFLRLLEAIEMTEVVGLIKLDPE